jgi:hypothetical protein
MLAGQSAANIPTPSLFFQDRFKYISENRRTEDDLLEEKVG